MRKRLSGSMITVAVAIAAVSVLVSVSITGASAQPTVEVPQFKYDPSWPKPLPEGWVLGDRWAAFASMRSTTYSP